jgi:outer membrane protein OmpA-like peptidoglycan-associated protein
MRGDQQRNQKLSEDRNQSVYTFIQDYIRKYNIKSEVQVASYGSTRSSISNSASQDPEKIFAPDRKVDIYPNGWSYISEFIKAHPSNIYIID